MKAWHSAGALSGAAAVAALFVAMGLWPARAWGQAAGARSGQTRAAKPDWLAGAGKDLRIRLSGTIVDKTAPAADCKLTVTLKTQFTRTNLPVAREGNRFQAWVPVGDVGWFMVFLSAASADGRRVASQGVSAFQLRQAAVDGLELIVKPPERMLEVTVVDRDRPVRDAFVTAEVVGGLFTSKTDGTGVARFPLTKGDRLSQLTAWTDDFRVGGYAFYRDPPRDPAGNKFTIELDRCRPQVIRVVNAETKAPVPNLPFVLTVGTGPPKYQFLGETPAREMRTNDKGEAVYRWFPDWKTQGSYIELCDPHWIRTAEVETVGGAILVKVKKSRFDRRQRVVGHVASTRGSVAGLHLEMRSFQGEEDGRVDVRSAFTDEKGAFAANFLPGSTYCIYANDVRSVSNIIDLVPYDPVTGRTNAPSLTISEGMPVEVTVTAGAGKAPVAHQFVHLQTPHQFTWRENGETRYAGGGRRWWVITDEQGRARTFALPGAKIEGSINESEWRSKVSAEVKTDGVTRLEFHREFAAARRITGRLLLTGVAADLSGAVVEIGSVDGQTHERLTLAANARGEFSFESKASRIGIYARTKDAKAAATAVMDRLDRPIELQLKPTGEFRGQLLGKEDRPLPGRAVQAEILVGKPDYSAPQATNFVAATFDTRTDKEGNYSFSGLPCEVRISLSTQALNGPKGETESDDIYLTPHEVRPRVVSKLWTRAERKLSFAERYARTLRDCRLSHFGVMVILFRPGGDTKQFVDANFLDYETTKDVMAFMQIKGVLSGKSGQEIEAFARSQHWPLPENGKVFALAMDPAGRELGRIEVDVKDPAGAQRAAHFIRQYAPAPVDARKKWDDAFAAARQSDRKVWVRISQRYCGPCFSLTRWLDDQQKLLSQDYVFLKIDDVRDLHGAEVAERLTRSEGQGVPFHAIFDADGRLLITSESPLGNIGYPSGFEGKRQLRKMLVKTRKKLTDREIDQIVGSLSD